MKPERDYVEPKKVADQLLAAEVAAAIEYYERTGQAPAGYEISLEP